jgi:c-di-GMP-binding flagellar brake protein YcgR
MGETVAGNFGDYPKKGLAVSIQGRSGEQGAAIVEEILPDSIWLKLQSHSSDPVFSQGAEVQIHYWDEGATAYSWVGSVLEVDGADDKHLYLSVSEEVNIQRRKSYRTRARVPFSFTVVEAAENDLVAEEIRACETENISSGGLLFRDDPALGVGDRLALKLHLSSSQQVETTAWVVRSEPTVQEDPSVRWIALKFLDLTTENQNQLVNSLKSYYE